jgi:deazaflavin-dependent oxidoreductase (nitroreductase family)
MSSPGQYLRLETTGRRTGKPHNVLLRYATVEGGIVLFPQANGHQDWVANLQSNPKVRIFGEGRIFGGQAKVKRADSLDDPVLAAFWRKYGGEVVRSGYWGRTKYVEVQLEAGSSPADFDELIYGDLEAAFDGVANDYDRHIFGNAMNVWLRNRSVALMSRVFRRGELILEIGCGTGTETLRLARSGIHVLATDISSKMLSVLKRKAEKAALTDFVTPIHARPYALKEIVRRLGHAEIDGAYSTYGAINTEPRLQDLFASLHSMIRSGGSLILGVWNKYCLYEMLGYALRLKPSMIGARFRNPVPVGKSRFCVASNAYSVGTLERMISGYFKLDKVYGVCIFLPPSNLTKYLPPEPILGLVRRADLAVEAIFPWNRLGDHFLGVYSKIG